MQEKTNILFWPLYGIILLGALLASFNANIFSVEGAEYHWEYFVGPVRAIKAGLELAYIPSQYGSLNIIFASLFPGSALKSFYLFQSTLLVITYIAVTLTLLFKYSGSVYSRILFCIVFYFALFLADPGLIGPQPFPSSSVIRFFPCYLIVIFSLIAKNLRQMRAYSLISLLLAYMWSAEAYVYCSLPVILLALMELKNRDYKSASMYIAVILISNLALYKSGLFLKQFEYAFGYASGYGYTDLKLGGIVQVLIILITVSIMFYVNTLKNRMVCMRAAVVLGVLLGISTYFVGRPVPQNITAVLPLLFLLTLIIYRESYEIGPSFEGLGASLILIFLSFVVLAPATQASTWKIIGSRDVGYSKLESDRHPATEDLVLLTSKVAEFCSKPLAIADDNASLPKFNACEFTESKIWLPSPLQLVQEPLSVERKNEYINSHLNYFGCGVLIVDQNSSMAKFVPSYLEKIKITCQQTAVHTHSNYIIYEFEKQ
jgi:hypothetical protein